MGRYRIGQNHQHHCCVGRVPHEAMKAIGFQGLVFSECDIELEPQYSQLDHGPDTQYGPGNKKRRDQTDFPNGDRRSGRAGDKRHAHQSDDDG